MTSFSREGYLAQLLECSPNLVLVGIANDLCNKSKTALAMADMLDAEIGPLPDNKIQLELLEQLRRKVKDIAAMAGAIMDYDAKCK